MTSNHESISQPSRPGTRLILVCQAEGLHHHFADLTTQLTPDDTGLTAAGWAQADGVALWLQRHVQVDSVLSGPQLPSRLTAQRIALTLKLPLRIQQKLPPSVLASDRPPLPENGDDKAHRLPLTDPLPMLPEAEALPFLQELQEAFADILEHHWGKTVVVVTHGSAIAAVVGRLTGARDVQIRIDHTSLTEICRQDGQWHIAYVNKLGHQPIAPLPVSATAAKPTLNGEKPEHLEAVRRNFNRAATVYAHSKWEHDPPRIRDFLRFADLPENLEVLDVGVGPGIVPILFMENGAASALGVDISEGMLEQAEYARLSRTSVDFATRIGYRLAPAHNLPFQEQRFDLVCCRLLLQHLHNPQAAIQEMLRVIKPGGHLILAELLSADDPVKRATQNAIEERRDPTHVAARSADQYRALLVDAGLTILKSETALYERDLEEWLDTLDAAPDDRNAVTEMVVAGLETDAAGINARYRNGRLIFDQRMLYLKAAVADGSS